MEISDVRKRVLDTIDRSRRNAAERRARADEASREYGVFLETIAIPIARQVANALRAESFLFTVSTPGGSVRLTSERTSQDYIELTLDTTGATPAVLGHVSRARGRRVLESERPIHAGGRVAEITENDVLSFLMKELEPFVEK